MNWKNERKNVGWTRKEKDEMEEWKKECRMKLKGEGGEKENKLKNIKIKKKIRKNIWKNWRGEGCRMKCIFFKQA